ncbi:MAG TPA: ParB/RepB/Spo0J family partition protein, partial [Oligoflexia bacterium]|nr:ParB/RepB/Spo0J family partition protein [Oligoflexia bacterium]
FSVLVSSIAFSPFQTREIGSDSELEELAQSISSRGVIQPVIVRPLPASEERLAQYELVCGERRLRAAKIAGLERIPAVVRTLSDQQAAEFSIIENAQRENLNPVEEALAYKHLLEKYNLTQAEVAQVIGKNRATVANAVRLLHLDPRVLEMLRQDAFSAGHARALLMLEEGAEQYRFAKRVIQQELSVRALETQIGAYLARKTAAEEPSAEAEKELAAIDRQRAKIESWLGLERVSLRHDEHGRRCLSLRFDSEAAWKRFMAKIRE